jgi:hypothetical protein
MPVIVRPVMYHEAQRRGRDLAFRSPCEAEVAGDTDVRTKYAFDKIVSNSSRRQWEEDRKSVVKISFFPLVFSHTHAKRFRYGKKLRSSQVEYCQY